MRTFDSGATRDSKEGKLEYVGYFSHPVMVRFAEYMHENRIQADGNVRAADNWKKGIPIDAYMDSMFRHFMDVWGLYLKGELLDRDRRHILVKQLMALMFNVQGMAHELIKEDDNA